MRPSLRSRRARRGIVSPSTRRSSVRGRGTSRPTSRRSTIACRELLGLSDENARSRASIIETRIHPDDRERLNAGLMRAADPAAMVAFRASIESFARDGSERWALAFARMHFVREGEAHSAAQLIGTVLDITDQKRAETRQRLLARLGAELLVAADEQRRACSSSPMRPSTDSRIGRSSM